jgi:16S rRNA (uracil1498-N3)-methyltransferase
VHDHGAQFPSSVHATAHTYLDRLDDECTVEGADAHHLSRVRRVRAGEVVTAADGYGRWRVYDVARVGGAHLTLRAVSEVAHEPRLSPALTVACALTKGDRAELVVQKLTELGVDAVLLVRAARSVVRWDDDRAAAALDRLRRVAREAGAQARRARLPTVDGVVAARDLAGRPGLVLADPRGAPASALDPRAGEWVVAVGPEGGFDDAELAAYAGAPRLAVGPHVLRAETAAIATAAALAGRRAPAP